MAALGYLASILMGLSLGLIGGGGSILTVPILVYLFGINPVLSTGYSLFIVGLTALVGGLLALKRGDVDLKTGAIFAIPSFIGVYATRRFLVPVLPDEILQLAGFTLTKPLLMMLVFASLMIAASLSMIRSNESKTKKAELKASLQSLIIGVEGLVVGAVTGFVGAGGGFLIIPALVVIVGLPMRIAVGTSLLIIAVKSLIGFLGDVATQPFIDWQFLMTIAAIAVVGIFIGGRLSKYIPEKSLKRAFGFFVLVMGLLILSEQARQFFS